MLNFKTFRGKFVFVVLISAVLIQLIYFTQLYQNTRIINKQVDGNLQNTQLRFIEQKVSSTFKNIDIVVTTLLGSNFTKYSTNYWNLKNVADADNAKEELNNDVNNLQIDPNIVDSIYYIGLNSNQRNFYKSIGSQQVMDELIPSNDLLTKTNLISVIYKGSSLPIFINKDELINELDKSINKISNDEYLKLKKFCLKLENKFIVSNYYLGGTSCLAIITLKQDLFKYIFKSVINHNEFITILDKDKSLVWSNFVWNSSDLKVITEEVNNKGTINSDWVSLKSSNNLMHYLSNKKPEEINVIYTRNTNYVDIKEVDFIGVFLLYSLILVIMSVLVAYKLSAFITMTLKYITEKLTLNADSNVLHKIPFEMNFKRWISASSTKTKCFSVFLLTIIIQSIVSGFIYSYYILSNYKTNFESTVSMSSMQIASEISDTMSSFFMVNSLIPSKILEQNLLEVNRLYKSESNNLIDNFIVRQPIGLNGFSYFALLDANGYVRYQSSYSENPEIFSLNSINVKENFKKTPLDVFWYIVSNESFNKPMITIVKKLYSTKNNTNTDVIGYFMMYLNTNIFNAVKTDSNIGFFIMDNENRLIYESSDNNYENVINNGNSKNRIQTEAKIANSNWTIFVYRKMEDMQLTKQNLLLGTIVFDFSVIIISFIISSLLSALLVKPIEKMKQNISEISKDEIYKTIKNSYKDEVGQLVSSYNTMIDKINKLMKENTDQKLKEQELITLKTQAEMNMLQQQINPHFLYNALELINLHAMELGDNIISKMAQTLALIFRFSISNKTNLVALEQEIEHAKAYATIMEIRFKNKLVFNWELDEATMSIKVLKLFIQPLIENAVKHGLYEFNSKGVIIISTRIIDERLYISVEDNGIGMEPEELSLLINSLEGEIDIRSKSDENNESNGIGLKNVYKRLMIYYKGNVKFVIESKLMKGTKIMIDFPLNKLDK